MQEKRTELLRARLTPAEKTALLALAPGPGATITDCLTNAIKLAGRYVAEIGATTDAQTK
jgi:hypothetical protein